MIISSSKEQNYKMDKLFYTQIGLTKLKNILKDTFGFLNHNKKIKITLLNQTWFKEEESIKMFISLQLNMLTINLDQMFVWQLLLLLNSLVLKMQLYA